MKAQGDNTFVATNPVFWTSGTASTDGFGSIQSHEIEGSNVDLSREFSELVIVQRGYQASSEVVTTADQMLQQLFTMNGGSR